MNHVLTTERLVLRPVTLRDHAALLAHWTTPDVRRFLALVADLRETESSAYTERETPIFVGRAMPLEEALDEIDGAAARVLAE